MRGVKEDVEVGRRFSKIVIISEVEQCGKDRILLCKCDCGKVFKTKHRYLYCRKPSQSCGCLRGGNDHQGYNSRIYHCWNSMKQRSLKRVNCKIHPPWLDFKIFKKWAKGAGYDDSLVLCRNGDKGDYAPDNCRWDTQGNNLREALCGSWELICPKGVVYLVDNLLEFCKSHGLIRSCISRTADGQQKSHKGWLCRKI